MNRPLKIDIIVHGRFHAFHLANGLRALGHDVLVHTNYPSVVVTRFGLPARCVRSFVGHGIAGRIDERLRRWIRKDVHEKRLHTVFGRWAARGVRPDADIVHGFSGVMEETLRLPRSSSSGQIRTIVRGSAHILEQARLLRDEEQRAGVPIDQPSVWAIAREEREYALADKIIVLSTFAHRTFIAHGVAANRLLFNPLGVDVQRFRVDTAIADARQQRILSGAPLRVLCVGSFSYRKGALELDKVAAALAARMRFRFVGDRPREARALQGAGMSVIDFVNRVPEFELPKQYAWGDVFIFPTVEDGFAAVLLQAGAAGLPIIATPNCSAPDFVREGETGFLLPIRDANAFIERLEWCDGHRAELAGMAEAARAGEHTHPWESTAAELAALIDGA